MLHQPAPFEIPAGISQERLDLDGVRFWRIDTATNEERWASIFPATKGFTVATSGCSGLGHLSTFSKALAAALEHVECQSDAEHFAAMDAEVANSDDPEAEIARQREATWAIVDEHRNIRRTA